MNLSFPRIHPLAAGAAASIIVCSVVVAAAFTGLIPSAVSRKADPAEARPAAEAACVQCGTVVGVRSVPVSGSPSGVGAVAGGVTGAVVGSQFGRGDGRTALTILGAAGGALAGNSIEKNMNKSTAWRVTVRMDDGSMRTVSQPEQPALAVGDKVRIADGRAYPLVADGRR